MSNKFFLPFIFLNFIFLSAQAQTITYSTPDRKDVRLTDFSIIGNFNNRSLIYEHTPEGQTINIFDDKMNLVDKKEMSFLPSSILGADVIAYENFYYFIYQYQKSDVINCAVAKMDGAGKIIGEPVILDTTKVNFTATKKIYNILYSENKQKIAIYKVKVKNNSRYIFSSDLFDGEFGLLHKSSIVISMLPEKNYLSDATLDNDGNIAFARIGDISPSDETQAISLFVESLQKDSLVIYLLTPGKIYLDNVRIKSDNLNHRFLITSFFSKSKSWKTDGIYCAVWNKDATSFTVSKSIFFNNDFKNRVTYKGSKSSFSNHHLRNIIMRRDGGFLITSESVFAESKNASRDNPGRWDFTYTNSEDGYLHIYFSETSSTTYEWPWASPDPRISRLYYAYSIAVMSFDSTANMEWSNVIPKNQFGNNSFEAMGFGTYLTGGNIGFLYNQPVKRSPPLQFAIIDASGKFVSTPTVKRLDRHYDFMPLFMKQINAHEAIIPCTYRDHFCFAKIEF